jgi:hypothetical protein
MLTAFGSLIVLDKKGHGTAISTSMWPTKHKKFETILTENSEREEVSPCQQKRYRMTHISIKVIEEGSYATLD